MYYIFCTVLPPCPSFT